MAAHTAHLEIDLRFDADGIRGEVCRDAGPPRLFSGWLGLIGALDGLLNDDTDEESS